MYTIPKEIEINGKSFKIRNDGDYRMVIDCFSALNDYTLTDKERLIACLIIFYDGMQSIDDLDMLGDLECATTKMFKFFNCGEVESPGARMNAKLIDWDTDSQLICSAINKVANKEIRDEKYLHWWTFMGYYFAIGDSPLATIVSIRNKVAKGKKLEKEEREFKNNNPQYFTIDSRTIEQKEAEDLARQLWNSGK